MNSRQSAAHAGNPSLQDGTTNLPRARWVLIFLLGGDALAIVFHLLLSSHPFVGQLFDLDKEANFPTWYTSFKLILAALAAGACYLAERQDAEDTRLRFTFAWLLVAVFMLGMSLDETGQVHERLTDWLMSVQAGENLRRAFQANETNDSLYWTVVFSPLMIMATTLIGIFYFTRFRNSRLLLSGCVAAFLLLALSAFLETREAAIIGVEGYFSPRRFRQYHTLVTFEETAELVATSLIFSVHYAYALRRIASGRQRGGPL